MCGGFFKKGIGKIIAKALPIAAAFIPGVGPLASAALSAGAGALSSRLQGAGWGDALKSGALSGLGTAAMPFLGNAFQGAFPETAGALGIHGGPTLFDSIGMPSLSNYSAPSGSAAMSALDSAFGKGNPSGLTQGAMNADSFGGSNLAPADKNMLSHAVSSSGVNNVMAAPQADSSSFLDKAGSWIGDHPLTTAGVVLGGAQAIASVRQRQQQEKDQQEMQAAQAAQNAQDTANWKLTLNTPSLPRNINPDLQNFDWSRYGYGPEREMLTNNRLNYGQMANGGAVRRYAEGGVAESPDESPEHMNRMDALRRLARHSGDSQADKQAQFVVNRYMNSNYPGNFNNYMKDEYGDVPITRSLSHYAQGGGVPLPRTGIKLVASPRGMNAPSTQMPFTSLMPKLHALSMNSKVKRMTGAKVSGSGHKFADGGKSFPRKNGKISGPGGPTGDKIKAMLSDGEYVIKSKSVSHLGHGDNNMGASILDMINNAPAERLRQLGSRIRSMA